MRIAVWFLTMALLPFLAFAVNAESAEKACTLQNKVFCGTWEDDQGFKTTILGHLLLSSNADPASQNCIIIDEFVDEKYPYSILKCTYFHSYHKKNVTSYELYYLSEKTEQENARVKGFENIFSNTGQSLRELFLVPDWDRNGNTVLVPNWTGGFLSRKVKK